MSNTIVVFGRLTDNPEMKTLQDGKTVTNFTLADNHGKDKASFFRCSAFGKTAELISKCQKAHRLIVSGRMEEQKWTDQQTQQPRTGWNLVVNEMNYVEPAPQNNQTQQPQAQQPYGTPPAYNQPPTGYPPQQGAYTPPPAAQGYGAPPAQPYGAPQQRNYAASYGAPPAGAPAPQYPPQQQPAPQYSAQPPQQGYTTAPGAVPEQRLPF